MTQRSQLLASPLALLVALACQTDPAGGPRPVGSASAAEAARADRSAQPPAGSASSGSAASAPAPSGSVARVGRAAPSASAVPVAKDSLATYWRRMGEGRKATIAKEWPRAEEAFGQALLAVPDDARAHGERGYARLLAGDLARAAEDLDRAAALTTDPKLLAQVWFNYGLAAEQTGDLERARACFARSNDLRPTEAARKKLVGKTECVVTLTREPPNWSVATHADWKAAIARANDDVPLGDLEESDLATLCGDGWSTDAPCAAVLGGVGYQSLVLWLPVGEKVVAVSGLSDVGGRCGGAIDPRIVSADERTVHLAFRAAQGVSVLVTEKDGAIVPCEDGATECMSACADDAVEFVDVVVDRKTGKSLAHASRPGTAAGTDPVRVDRADAALRVAGGGCDAELPLADAQ